MIWIKGQKDEVDLAVDVPEAGDAVEVLNGIDLRTRSSAIKREMT